ncbi:ABC transporter ATP-binding protein [Alloyangia pacifica]|uniref:ATP-binding cassette, subfamily B n=1 Tax=Alloyangia pacifica TaxID=311180 RepID=A0A1I6RLK3_9RHOB|nr:ABC transporter ATP-binding protein [Alloyangia pacifica]SDI69285.1 ATP-binding cassette, subfamily B [Alloyangia pacifica]SFS65526.1 ATP-binding cassette, subfamily B [Alloyangia pacifica]
MLDDREISSLEALSNGWRVIREALPPLWKTYAISVVCMVGVAFFTGALANSTKTIVNGVFVDATPGAAWRVAGLVIAISAAKSLMTYGSALIAAIFNRSISITYQKKLFEHILNQDVAYLAREHPPRQMAVLMQIGRSAGRVVMGVCNRAVVEVLTLIALLGVMVMQDPGMTLLCGVVFPLIFWLVSHLSKKIRSATKRELKLAGRYFEVGSEIFDGIKTVKSFQMEEASIARFDAAVDKAEKRVLHVARISATTVPMMELLGGLVIGLFVVYGAWQTADGSRTPGEFAAFITAFLMAYQPAERLSRIWVDMQKQMVLVTQMYDVLDREPVRMRYGTADLPRAHTPEIALQDVSFRYGEDAAALTGVSTVIPAGERVAVVGSSGAGKTTLIDILQRFYDPQEGKVTLDGTDIRDISHEALHRSIAFISQDVFLFDGTLAQNIADGNPDASREDIEQAARRACLEDVIATLPKGLDSPVGPNGQALSGGQRQRLAIARGIAKKASIYIFDEITSALDPENERAIMASVIAALDGATLIFVTHRPSTLAYVERVIVMSEGRLVASDTPAALAQDNPAFNSLFEDTTPGHAG